MNRWTNELTDDKLIDSMIHNLFFLLASGLTAMVGGRPKVNVYLYYVTI